MPSVERPLLRHFRARRIPLLYARFGMGASGRVLDVKGNAEFWQPGAAQGLPMPQWTIVNLRPERGRDHAIAWVPADGRASPFRDEVFAVALHNSVIELLGDAGSQSRFAAQIQRVGARHFVETPKPRSPIVPHLVAHFLHCLPRTWQRTLIRNCSVWGIRMRPTRGQGRALLQEVPLLAARDMRRLVPASEFRFERVPGLTKSLIAAGGRK